VISIAGPKLAVPESKPDGAAGDAEAGDKSSQGSAVIRDGFASRDEALQTLLKVADYFRKHERQSIVPYSLEQVVRWGRMSLPELLTELGGKKDKTVLEEMFRNTGISGLSGKTDKGQSE
jgi:type VI secretion system protein ImpA